MQTIAQHALTDTMYDGDTPVLNCRIRYPQFTTTCNQKSGQSINGYYISLAREKGRYCRDSLYPQAVKSADFSRGNGYPFFPYEFDISFKVTYHAGCIVSLYFDQYEFTGGAHGSTVRASQTWDFETGRQLSLGDFFHHSPGYIEDIQSWIEYEIAGRLESEPAAYFEDYPKLLRSAFRAENYYLTPNGIVLYDQQYDIAPYSSGLPEFILPYSG